MLGTLYAAATFFAVVFSPSMGLVTAPPLGPTHLTPTASAALR
ncbi:hypothetical protein [Magnetospirillum sp. UT-4]|nr:hypothetical protein [Magnetospirillum sp. UT-4]